MSKRVNNRKMILIAALIVIIAAGSAIVGISAYLTVVSRMENKTDVGYVTTSIEEDFVNPDIKPNKTTVITKKVQIKNTGPNTAGVRVRAEFSSTRVLDYTTVDYNTDDWEQDGDYWYYKTPLASGEETTALFNTLTLENPAPEEVADFDVFVYSESRSCSDDATLTEIKGLFTNS